MECEKDSCICTHRKNIKFEFSFRYESSAWITCFSFQTDECSFDVQWKYSFQNKGFYRIAVCEWCANVYS